MGTMGCMPQQLGISFADIQPTLELHSGDDEDMALLAQRKHIPMICIARPAMFLRPNRDMDDKQPLFTRRDYIRAASRKMRRWSQWQINHVKG